MKEINRIIKTETDLKKLIIANAIDSAEKVLEKKRKKDKENGS